MSCFFDSQCTFLHHIETRLDSFSFGCCTLEKKLETFCTDWIEYLSTCRLSSLYFGNFDGVAVNVFHRQKLAWGLERHVSVLTGLDVEQLR